MKRNKETRENVLSFCVFSVLTSRDPPARWRHCTACTDIHSTPKFHGDDWWMMGIEGQETNNIYSVRTTNINSRALWVIFVHVISWSL